MDKIDSGMAVGAVDLRLQKSAGSDAPRQHIPQEFVEVIGTELSRARSSRPSVVRRGSGRHAVQ